MNVFAGVEDGAGREKKRDTEKKRTYYEKESGKRKHPRPTEDQYYKNRKQNDAIENKTNSV